MVFKQVFRIAFVTLIWKRYKALIISTALLIFSLYLIGQIHADFLQHWELQEDNSQTGQSFIYKWLAYIGCISLYCAFHYFKSSRKPADTAQEKKAKQQSLTSELENLSDDEDPFASIRKREKLRSRSDFILKNKKEDK